VSAVLSPSTLPPCCHCTQISQGMRELQPPLSTTFPSSLSFNLQQAPGQGSSSSCSAWMQVPTSGLSDHTSSLKKPCFCEEPGACCFGQDSATWHQSADWQAEKHCTETRSITANYCSLLAGAC